LPRDVAVKPPGADRLYSVCPTISYPHDPTSRYVCAPATAGANANATKTATKRKASIRRLFEGGSHSSSGTAVCDNLLRCSAFGFAAESDSFGSLRIRRDGRPGAQPVVELAVQSDGKPRARKLTVRVSGGTQRALTVGPLDAVADGYVAQAIIPAPVSLIFIHALHGARTAEIRLVDQRGRRRMQHGFARRFVGGVALAARATIAWRYHRRAGHRRAHHARSADAQCAEAESRAGRRSDLQ